MGDTGSLTYTDAKAKKDCNEISNLQKTLVALPTQMQSRYTGSLTYTDFNEISNLQKIKPSLKQVSGTYLG